jgi:hypothetical protein
MMCFKKTPPLTVLVAVILSLAIQAFAQQGKHPDKGFSIGASLNYGGIYFERDGSFLNDLWTNSPGYQFHVLYGYNISSVFSLNTGAEIIVNRYDFKEQRTPETNEQGQATGNFFTTSMNDAVGTTYLRLPVNLIVRPLANKSFFAAVGPDVSFKVSHKNGILITRYASDSDETNENQFEDTYDIPERSRGTMFFLNAGLGYSINSNTLPLTVQLGARQSITPYMDGDDFITSWIRNLSFTISYRL